jgi:hypothetical protein
MLDSYPIANLLKLQKEKTHMMKEQAHIIELTDEELETMRGGCHYDDDCDRGYDDDYRRDDCFDGGRRFSYEESYSYSETDRFSFRRW